MIRCGCVTPGLDGQRTGGLGCVRASRADDSVNAMLRVQSGKTEPCSRSTTGKATSKRPRNGSTVGSECRRSIAQPAASQPVGAIAWRIAVSACWIASFVGRPGTRITANVSESKARSLTERGRGVRSESEQDAEAKERAERRCGHARAFRRVVRIVPSAGASVPLVPGQCASKTLAPTFFFMTKRVLLL